MKDERIKKGETNRKFKKLIFFPPCKLLFERLSMLFRFREGFKHYKSLLFLQCLNTYVKKKKKIKMKRRTWASNVKQAGGVSLSHPHLNNGGVLRENASFHCSGIKLLVRQAERRCHRRARPPH